MRSSLRSIGSAVLLSVVVLWPASGVFAESSDFDNETSDGSQFQPAGADAYVAKPGNLNSVPEDGTASSDVPGTDGPFVKQILAARPNEDLVICIAGCYSGRNRVVYAQPSARVLRGSLASTMAPSDPQKLGALGKRSQSAAVDPDAPVILNRTN